MSTLDTKSLMRSAARVITGTELPVLLLSLLIVGGVWGFVGLADEVLEGDTHQIDRAILLSMRHADDVGDPLGPRWFEETMRDFTALGGMAILTLLSLAVVGYLLLLGKRGMAALMTVSVTGGIVLSTILKMGFDRPRPDLVPHGSHVLTASFPSGHSMLSAVVFLTLGSLLARYVASRKLKMYILTLAIATPVLVGISRVYLGVHWPSDVLAGWTAGACWALLCWLAAWWLQQRGQIEENIEEQPADRNV